MHTLFDFITHVKGIEYILSILFIGGFLLLWEVLKPKPFATVVSAGKEDLAHLRDTGGPLHYVGRIAAAPFVGLAYIVMLPVGFFLVVLLEAVNLAVKGVSTLLGRDISFNWNPLEAYFTGRKNKRMQSPTDGEDKK
jgi:hypothetical protein